MIQADALRKNPEATRAMLRDPLMFARGLSELKLRSYQEEAAQAIVDSVLNQYGDMIVVMFPRQSGKNELQAQLEAYLLSLFHENEVNIVKISPTWRPQSQNAMRRLERVLVKNAYTQSRWRKESGYLYRVGRAGIFFFSGAPEANIVGATASLMLEVDEAQDVGVEKYDKDIAPMAASTNATQVFWGTAWTSRTLLARQLRAAQEEERLDGRRRAFRLTAEQVIQEVPRYEAYVRRQVALLGRQHPLVRTQYFSEEIDDESGMFPPRRRALMQGAHPRQGRRIEGRTYALLVDVAGEDETPLEGAAAASARRDMTALTVVEVDLSTLADPALKAPTYRAVERAGWLGVKHSLLYAQITALAEAWQARWLVIDATGVGAGLASFLERALPGRVIPFVFTVASKSKLGWDFLTIVEMGRFKDWAGEPFPGMEQQWVHCQMQIIPGAGRRLRWGVPDGLRDPLSGELVHDDWVISAALCAVLDRQAWNQPAAPLLIRAADPLAAMDGEGF